MIKLPLKDYQELLRDYFAAKAMQGTAASEHGDSMTYVEIAKWSYKMADAMLEERSK